MEAELIERKYVILFVGEGDFSYAASYVEKTNPKSEQVFATCLSSTALDSRQKSNIEVIQSNGGSVLTDVDATKLETHRVLNKYAFKKIIFNFPHVPQKMNIRENRRLVEFFLKSAEKLLEVNGRIFVALCRGQGGTDAESEVREWANSWQVVELSSKAGLILCDVYPFDADNFQRYECSGYRGLSKSFHREAAVTHVFRRCQPASLANQTAELVSTDCLIDWFISHSSDLYKSLSQRLHSPYAKLVEELDATMKSTFPSLESIFVKNLLNCGRDFSSDSQYPKEQLEFKKFDICDKCLGNVMSVFLLDKAKTGEEITTSVTCCVCCVRYFDVSRPPVLHLISYFSSCKESLMDSLETLFKSLKELKYQNKDPTFSSWSDIELHSNQTIHTVEQTPIHNEINIQELHPIHAAFSIKKSNCRLFYTDIDVTLSDGNDVAENFFKIGHIVEVSYENKSYFAAMLDLECICALKFHVMDYRTLFHRESYFTTEIFQGMPLMVFRSQCLFPPTYTHDASFWVGDEFEEKLLLLLVWRMAGLLVKSIKLVDLYYDEATSRKSRCYRFVYQSCGEVLSKRGALEIHAQLGKIIEMSLKVSLR